jgi:hypothetical protein
MRERLLQTGCAALTTVLAVTLGGCKGPPPAAAPPKTAQVAVDVRCSEGQTFVSVDPWLLELNLGDTAAWSLTTNPPSQRPFSVDVAPKHGQWPFSGNGPQHGNGNNAARSGGPANAQGHHKYSITVVCGTQEQPGDSVVIDPDMDVH